MKKAIIFLLLLVLVIPATALAQDPDDPYGDDYGYYDDYGYGDGYGYYDYGDYGDYEWGFDDYGDVPFDDYLVDGSMAEDPASVRGEDGSGAAARYSINQGGITLLTPQDLAQPDRDQHAQIWTFITSIIPARWINDFFGEYELFSGGDTLAYVTQMESDPTRWILGVNTDVANDPGLLSGTLVHEFAHVLMLNNMQLGAPGGACATYNPFEGCSNPNSYINGFYSQFWTGIQLDGEGNAVAGTYEANPSAFVSDYAATNPVEDGAESFMNFVIRSQRPAGNTIAEQKIAFFYNFPELVQLREVFRSNIAALGINNAQ